MDKRVWLVLVAVIAYLLSLTPCDSSASEPSGDGKASTGQGPSGKVIVGTFGGDTVKVLSENVDPVLAKVAPNVKIVYAIGMNTERMTKLRVEKDGASSFDVIHVNDRDMQILINEGLLLKLDEAKMPNAKKIFPSFRSDYYIPYNFSANVILYNKEKVSPVPTSWEVLWDPKYKGKIGIQTNLWTDHMYIAALLEGTAYQNNWDAGWNRMLKLAEQELQALFFHGNTRHSAPDGRSMADGHPASKGGSMGCCKEARPWGTSCRKKAFTRSPSVRPSPKMPRMWMGHMPTSMLCWIKSHKSVLRKSWGIPRRSVEYLCRKKFKALSGLAMKR